MASNARQADATATGPIRRNGITPGAPCRPNCCTFCDPCCHNVPRRLDRSVWGAQAANVKPLRS